MRFDYFKNLKQTFVVAEIGNNHEGNFDNAIKLVEKAAYAKVDAVKFQTFKTEGFVSPVDRARFDRLKSFELSYKQFEDLAIYANSLGLTFFSTPLDLESADFLHSISPLFKIASSDNNFWPLIEKILSFKKPLIISTGLLNLSELKILDKFIKKTGRPSSLAYLHCVTSYPAEPGSINLRAIPLLQKEFSHSTIGYSDHTLSTNSCLAAVSLGAKIIEKHFTLDKNFSAFRDHQLSATPDEMKVLVENIREIESLLGNAEKKIQKSEVELLGAVRRSIATNKNMAAGQKITDADLVYLRPSGDFDCADAKKVVGKKLKNAKNIGEQIKKEDL